MIDTFSVIERGYAGGICSYITGEVVPHFGDHQYRIVLVKKTRVMWVIVKTDCFDAYWSVVAKTNKKSIAFTKVAKIA